MLFYRFYFLTDQTSVYMSVANKFIVGFSVFMTFIDNDKNIENQWLYP